LEREKKKIHGKETNSHLDRAGIACRDRSRGSELGRKSAASGRGELRASSRPPCSIRPTTTPLLPSSRPFLFRSQLQGPWSPPGPRSRTFRQSTSDSAHAGRHPLRKRGGLEARFLCLPGSPPPSPIERGLDADRCSLYLLDGRIGPSANGAWSFLGSVEGGLGRTSSTWLAR
jgi:hypothetical protein